MKIVGRRRSFLGDGPYARWDIRCAEGYIINTFSDGFDSIARQYMRKHYELLEFSSYARVFYGSPSMSLCSFIVSQESLESG